MMRKIAISFNADVYTGLGWGCDGGKSYIVKWDEATVVNDVESGGDVDNV